MVRRIRAIIAALALIAVAASSAPSGAQQTAGGDLTPQAAPGLTGWNMLLPGTVFNPVTPKRVLDTRENVGLVGALGPGATGTLLLGGQVPSNAVAVALNVTSASATEASFITIWPSDEARPGASALNPAPGVIAPNGVTSKLSVYDSVSFFNAAGQVHLVADLVGYYTRAELPGPTTNWRTIDHIQGLQLVHAFPVRQVFPSVGVFWDQPAGQYRVRYNLQLSLQPNTTIECYWGQGGVEPLGRFGETIRHATNNSSEVAYASMRFDGIVSKATAGPIALGCTYSKPDANYSESVILNGSGMSVDQIA